MSVEELAYTVLLQDGDFEIRQYATHVVAATDVRGGFGWVGNVAFQRLAGYIFGKNRRRDTIAMTAPVMQEAASQQIAMTAPVMQAGHGDSWAVSFVMPAEFSLATLPEPLDTRVTLHARPEQLMAAVRYSGSWSRRLFNRKRRALEQFIQAHGYVPSGDVVFARYNPPMTLWFQRRNEVLIPVQASPGMHS